MGYRGSTRRVGWMLAAVLVLTGCGENNIESVNKDAGTQSVNGWRVMAASVEQVYRVPGNVTADDRIQLSSRITGFIQQIAVREGDRVSRGDLLIEIESAEVTGAIRTAEAALTAAETDLEDARRDVVKFAELAKQGSLPADTLRKAQVRFDLARSQLVEASSASETAVSNLRYTSIRSPADGVVISLNKRVGDLATTGAPILLIESHSSLVFQTYVAEKRVASLAVGQQIAVELDALERPLNGEVLRIVPSGDRVTRRFEVKVSLPITVNLLPGMFGRARFVVGATNRVLVARSMLVERGGLVGVMAIVDDHAEFRWLRIGQQWPEQVEVIAGLDEGELIVADPASDLFDGASLIVTPQQ